MMMMMMMTVSNDDGVDGPQCTHNMHRYKIAESPRYDMSYDVLNWWQIDIS